MTPATTSKTERTRQSILRAADECFREYGFDAARSTEIARRAGVAEGTIFLHYGSKLGLLTAVTCTFYDLLQAEAEDLLPSFGDAATRLRRLVDGWARRIETDWPLIRVFAQRSQIEPNSELSQAMTTLNRRYTRLFLGVINELRAEGALPREVPPTLIRDIIFGTLEHTARGQDITGHPLATRDAGQEMLDLLLRAPTEPGPSVGRLDTIEEKIDRVLAALDGTYEHRRGD